MKKILLFLMLSTSINALSQIEEVGSLKAYSERLEVSVDKCLKLLASKYGREICKLKAYDLENDFLRIELKKTTKVLKIDDCRISIIRKTNHIQVGIGEFDEKISKAKARRCLYMADNRLQLNSSLEFIAVKKDI